MNNDFISTIKRRRWRAHSSYAAFIVTGWSIGRELACGSTDRIMIQCMKNYVIMTSSGYEGAMNITAKLNAKLGLIFLDIECALEALMKLMG